MECLLKIQLKEYFKNLINFLIASVVLSTVLSLILFFVEDIKIGLNKEVVKLVLAAGALPLITMFALIVTVGMVIEYVVSVKLHLLAGYSRKSIFNVNIIMILVMIFTSCLIIATIASFGFKIGDEELIYHSMDLNIFFNSFIGTFLQLLLLTLTASFIAISFKKNMVLGFIILIYGFLSLNIVGLTDLDISIDILLKEFTMSFKEYIYYLVFSLVSLIGYKEVLRRY
ncbi:MAG: hypothetical protein WAO56_03575 [Miniphocaeibacter sp.]|uniref:hypothetical protein n=1 Tax=Miniphocaeibacter sp. TaxID=3100973 RepID=UPI003BAF107C